MFMVNLSHIMSTSTTHLLVKVDPVTGMVVNIADLKQCMEVRCQANAQNTAKS